MTSPRSAVKPMSATTIHSNVRHGRWTMDQNVAVLRVSSTMLVSLGITGIRIVSWPSLTWPEIASPSTLRDSLRILDPLESEGPSLPLVKAANQPRPASARTTSARMIRHLTEL